MKSILISIRPEWVAKILNGEKTIEVRKTAPKCDLPVDVYIYCTKGRLQLAKGGDKYVLTNVPCGRNGKVVAKFTLNKVEKFSMFDPYVEPTSGILMEACVSLGDARTYAGGNHPCYHPLYAWHISDLEIFDKPKELSEFKHPFVYCSLNQGFNYSFCIKHCSHNIDPERDDWYCGRNQNYGKPLVRAPQSWQYVKEAK